MPLRLPATVAPPLDRVRRRLAAELVRLGSRWLGPSGEAPAPLLPDRAAIAARYLRGTGLEIGALHQPFPAPAGVTRRFVDRMSAAALRRHYPELAELELVEVDVIDDGERLATVGDATQDFVIASHFLEHCLDPWGALLAGLRVLREGGHLLLVVPDKRATFDRTRPVTPLEHVLADHRDGGRGSRLAHYREWAEHVDGLRDPGEVAARAAQLAELDYSIHFHVWTPRELLELLAALRARASFDVELFLQGPDECSIVLRRTSGPAEALP